MGTRRSRCARSCLTAGLALLVSCANLFYRDVKYVVQVLLTFGIFFTPVFFEPEMFGALGARVMMVNPLAPLMEGLRLSVVHGSQPARHARRAGTARCGARVVAVVSRV